MDDVWGRWVLQDVLNDVPTLSHSNWARVRGDKNAQGKMLVPFGRDATPADQKKGRSVVEHGRG